MSLARFWMAKAMSVRRFGMGMERECTSIARLWAQMSTAAAYLMQHATQEVKHTQTARPQGQMTAFAANLSLRDKQECKCTSTARLQALQRTASLAYLRQAVRYLQPHVIHLA